MTNGIIRMTIIALLWIIVALMVVMSQPFSLRVLFFVAASGIVVFVPMYKKYFKKDDGQSSKQK